MGGCGACRPRPQPRRLGRLEQWLWGCSCRSTLLLLLRVVLPGLLFIQMLPLLVVEGGDQAQHLGTQRVQPAVQTVQGLRAARDTHQVPLGQLPQACRI